MKPINVKNAKECLEKFDPIEFKYNCASNIVKLTTDIKAKLERHENAYQFGSLTKQEYSSIVDNLRLVYNDENLIENDVKLFHLTEDKIVHQYLGIPLLDRLFDEDYFNFEWDMHIGQNFMEHRNDYYRDHFIHQIRNLVMMFSLLIDDEIGLYDTIKSFMPSLDSIPADSGKVPEYIRKKEIQFFEFTDDKNKQKLDDFINNYQNLVRKTVSKSDYLHEFYCKYVIFASAFLSALFHDMGYPICHFLEVRQRVSDYNPYLHMFTHNSVDSFDQLFSKLSDSLLFTIVSRSEIQSRLSINEDGKYDHGAYSAIAFLLPFYDSGLINSLSPEKQCAIEVAAVAIYNHTAKYNCIKFDDKNNYYQPIFRQNPISFLLRFCDDLQEWDRRYFEISTDSDLVICTKCGSPLILSENNDTKSDKRDSLMKYYCLCKTNDKPQIKHIKYDSFLKRKIYIVRTSDSVEFKIVYNKNNKEKLLVAKVNYNLYRLLKMCRINANYATHRLSELNGIKHIVDQDFNNQSESKSKFDRIVLDFFMTSNPILIKIRIIEEFIKKVSEDKLDINSPTLIVDAILNNVFNKKNTSLENEACSIWEKYSNIPYKTESPLEVYTYLQTKALPFYVEILEKSLDFKINKTMKADLDDKSYTGLIESVIKNNSNQTYHDVMFMMIHDCFVQYYRMPAKNFDNMLNDEYYSLYTPTDKEQLNQAVMKYCNKENAFNERTELNIIDYYSDLFFFDVINRFIEERKIIMLGKIIKITRP